MKKQTLFITVIILVGLGLGLWREHAVSSNGIQSGGKKTAALQVGTQLPLPQAVPHFALEDTDGDTFTEEDFKKHWSFLVFGYTRCPASCPVILNTLTEIQKHLRPRALVSNVFVTIEPEYDTSTQLKNFFSQDKYQNLDVEALTGAKSSIKEFAHIVGLHLSEATNDGSHMEHSGTMLLINPEGKIAAIFNYQDQPALIANDVKQLMHRYNRA